MDYEAIIGMEVHAPSRPPKMFLRVRRQLCRRAAQYPRRPVCLGLPGAAGDGRVAIEYVLMAGLA